MTLVALGDSVVHAEDSWAGWLARAMGRPLTRLSANGARSADVLDQLDRLPGEGCTVACLSVGTNDVLFDWDATGFAERLDRIVAAATAGAGRVVVTTVPLALAGFPGGGPVFRRRVVQANVLIAATAAVVVPGDDLSGPRLLQADRIHPTLEGQLLLADRAAAALGVGPAPSTLAGVPGTARASSRWAYHRVAAGQAPRRALKRALRRPAYRDPRGG